jgi:hypothetical protein
MDGCAGADASRRFSTRGSLHATPTSSTHAPAASGCAGSAARVRVTPFPRHAARLRPGLEPSRRGRSRDRRPRCRQPDREQNACDHFLRDVDGERENGSRGHGTSRKKLGEVPPPSVSWTRRRIQRAGRRDNELRTGRHHNGWEAPAIRALRLAALPCRRRPGCYQRRALWTSRRPR